MDFYRSAQTILNWHWETGLKIAEANFLIAFQRDYRRYIEAYSSADLHDPQVQQQLAEEQLYGGFAWAEAMHDTAENLLRSLRNANLLTDSACRKVVTIQNEAELLTAAKHYYAEFTHEEHLNIGGKNALLSSSLERTSFDPDTPISLIRPEVLGVRQVAYGELPSGLLDQVRSHNIIIRSIIAQPFGNLPENDQTPALV